MNDKGMPTTASKSAHWTAYDLIDKRLTVYAQRSLLRLLHGDAVQQKIAVDLITGVKTGVIEGIFVVNQVKPAQRARENGTYWWLLIPVGEDVICMNEPADRPPLLALTRAAARSNDRVDAALIRGWLQLLSTPFIQLTTGVTWPPPVPWKIMKIDRPVFTQTRAVTERTAMSQEAIALVGFLDLLMHLYYRYVPNRNVLGPNPRKLVTREERFLMRIHALLLAGNYANSEDLNYMYPHTSRQASGTFTTGDYRFAEIIATSVRSGHHQNFKGTHNNRIFYADYGGKGTTCGYICHWMLWRLGCREQDINRTVYAYTGTSSTYETSDNTCRLSNLAARYQNHIRQFTPGPGRNACDHLGQVLQSPLRQHPFAFPRAGDIIYLPSPAGGGSEHVFIYLGKINHQQETYWICAESGQEKYAATVQDSNGDLVSAMRQYALFKSRKEDTSQPFFQVANQNNRSIAGIVPLEKLTYHALPDVEAYYQNELAVSNYNPLDQLRAQQLYDNLVQGWVYDSVGTKPFLQLTDRQFCQLIMDIANNP